MSAEKKPITGADIHLSAEAKAAIVNALVYKVGEQAMLWKVVECSSSLDTLMASRNIQAGAT